MSAPGVTDGISRHRPDERAIGRCLHSAVCNLSVQLGKLQEGGLIDLERELVGARPRTTYFLSESGIDRLCEYRRVILDLLDGFP